MLKYTEKGKEQEMMLGGRGFVRHANLNFEFNCRSDEWSLIQFLFLKSALGAVVEN